MNSKFSLEIFPGVFCLAFLHRLSVFWKLLRGVHTTADLVSLLVASTSCHRGPGCSGSFPWKPRFSWPWGDQWLLHLRGTWFCSRVLGLVGIFSSTPSPVLADTRAWRLLLPRGVLVQVPDMAPACWSGLGSPAGLGAVGFCAAWLVCAASK